jgi:hypothetical protein
MTGDEANGSHPTQQVTPSDEISSEVTEERLLQKLMSGDETEILPAIRNRPVQIKQTDSTPPVEIVPTLPEEVAAPTIPEDVTLPAITEDEIVAVRTPEADTAVVTENETEIDSTIVQHKEDSQSLSLRTSEEEQVEITATIPPSMMPKDHVPVDAIENNHSVDARKNKHKETIVAGSETTTAVEQAATIENSVLDRTDTNISTSPYSDEKPKQRRSFLWRFLQMFA